jgi:hypothetical protein
LEPSPCSRRAGRSGLGSIPATEKSHRDRRRIYVETSVSSDLVVTLGQWVECIRRQNYIRIKKDKAERKRERERKGERELRYRRNANKRKTVRTKMKIHVLLIML